MFYALNKYGHTGAFKKLRDIPADATRVRAGEAGKFDALNLSRALADTANRWQRWADMDIARRFMRLRFSETEGMPPQWSRCRASLTERLGEYKRERFRKSVQKIGGDIAASLGSAVSMVVMKQWRDRSKYQQRHGYSNGQDIFLSIVATPDDFVSAMVDTKNKTIRVGNVLAKKTGRGRGDWTITELHPLKAAILEVLEHATDV